MRHGIYLCLFTLSILSISSILRAAPLDRPIQSGFTHLQEINRDASLKASQKASKVTDIYRATFSALQNATTLNSLSNADLQLTYRAASLAAFYTHDDLYIADMRVDFEEMKRRHTTSGFYYSDMYQTLLLVRDFPTARAFLHEHPDVGLHSIPVVRDLALTRGGGRMELVVSPDRHQLTLVKVHFDSHAQVVVVGHPLCHFTQFAIHDIEANPSVRAILKAHSIWISPQDGNLDIEDFQQWNHEHPDLPMAMVWKESGWPNIDYWGTPTFYFFKNGVLVDKVVGWAKAGSVKDKNALIAGLRKVGLLH